MLALLVTLNLGLVQQAIAAGDAATLNPLEGNAEAIEAGRQLYSNTCLFCHGAAGIGARAPNLVEGMFRPNGGADDAIAYGIILQGRPGTLMGGYDGTLSEDQIWQIISYLRSEGIKRAEAKKKPAPASQ